MHLITVALDDITHTSSLNLSPSTTLISSISVSIIQHVNGVMASLGLVLRYLSSFLPLVKSNLSFGFNPSTDMEAGCLFVMWYSVMLILQLKSSITICIWLCCLSRGNVPTWNVVEHASFFTSDRYLPKALARVCLYANEYISQHT